MIYELRTYRLKTGKVGDYLRLVEEQGIELQRSYLGQLVGYLQTDIGPLNEIVHIWAYESLGDRERRRMELAADPEWQVFIPKIQVLIETMETKILRAAPFSPMK